jgi:hypothetical protein
MATSPLERSLAVEARPPTPSALHLCNTFSVSQRMKGCNGKVGKHAVNIVEAVDVREPATVRRHCTLLMDDSWRDLLAPQAAPE